MLDFTGGFNARIAKEMSDSFLPNELTPILSDIQEAARKGEYKLPVYRSLNQKTCSALNEIGFKVISQGSSAIQMDGLYYMITWE